LKTLVVYENVTRMRGGFHFFSLKNTPQIRHLQQKPKMDDDDDAAATEMHARSKHDRRDFTG
jgi:hypothetical protein